jgi:hypothetical protein
MKMIRSNAFWRNSAMIAIAGALLITGCKKDKNAVGDPDDHDHDDAELITSMVLEFSDTANIQPNVTVAFRDPDGEGGNAATEFDTITLSANTVYSVKITLLDESKNPAVKISDEVKTEGDEHLFCFDVTGANASIVKTDSDGTYEIGLDSRWTIGAASNGAVKVTLKHQPGVKNGTCGVGDTDVEVNFITKIITEIITEIK